MDANVNNIIYSKLLHNDKSENITEIINFFIKINKEYISLDLYKNIHHVESVKSIDKQNNKSKPTLVEVPICKDKINNLDNLKVQGLKELCSVFKLKTNKCKYRKDYIDLLLEYKNN